MKYNWNWSIFGQMASDGSGTWLHYLLVGLLWTLATALAAWVIALVIGAVVGTLRTTPIKWLVRIGNFYVEIFRNIPLIEQESAQGPRSPPRRGLTCSLEGARQKLPSCLIPRTSERSGGCN